MKKIKVLEAIRQGKVGGGESHVMELCSYIDKTKYEPVVLSFTPGPMVDELNSRGIKTAVIHSEKAFDFFKWKEVRDFLVKEKIDLVHAHGTRANSNVFWAAKSLGLPLIYTVHGWSFHIDQNFPLFMLREYSEKFLTKMSDKTICVSKSNEIDGLIRFNLRHSTVIHNAINLDKYNPGKPFKNLRSDLGISYDKIVIGYIVRITKQKDPFTMLKAMKHIVEQNENVVLLMVGDGDLKASAVKMTHELGIGNNVIFLPARTDIPEILNAIDIYCLPSLWEGFPIGILEAMAMNKPVIASPVDGTREMIEHEKTGLLVEHSNPEKLACKVIQLVNDSILRETITHNAYLQVHLKFGISRMVRKIENVYKEFMN